MAEHLVIIGAGQACAQAITSLRAEGFTGAITIVGDESYPPYQRPPLSKAYLAGVFERERLFLKPPTFYQEGACELLLGTSAESIDRKNRVVRLAGGRSLSYEKLLLATGSRVRRLSLEGANLPGICYLRGIADVDALRANFVPGTRLVVVGGGYIGLEVAAIAVKQGLDVTVIESLDRVMLRAVSPEMSRFYEHVHREAGVRIVLNAAVQKFEGKSRLESVCANGEFYPADIALVAVGIVPNVEIAEAAGLACDDGIVVDDCARTADPDIFAAGDCTRHIGRDGALIRLESVQNAIDQAKHAALAMMGKPTPYREVPWFWSDQFDLKLQIAGLARPGDVLVRRGDPATRKFAVFHLREERVAAVEAVNAAPEYIVGRRLIADGVAVSPDRLADTIVPMKSVA
jgi:3-phenylpropionate/trans-cinnamate dioxygenase ferredoxin reductase subunit